MHLTGLLRTTPLLFLLGVGALDLPHRPPALPVRVPIPATLGPQQRVDTIVVEVSAPVHPRGGRLIEELSIGVETGQPEYEFGEISYIAIGREGSILVGEYGGDGIRQYSRQGTFVRKIGRRGQGPGELSTPQSMVVFPDGTIGVFGTPWLNFYDSSGTYLRRWTLRPTGNAEFYLDKSGTLYERVYRGSTRGGTPKLGPAYWDYVRLGPDGRTADSVATPMFPPGEWIAWLAGNPTRPGAIATPTGQTRPFTPEGVSAWSPLGYLVTGFPSRYAIELHTRGVGSTVMSLRRSTARPFPVLEATRTLMRESIERRVVAAAFTTPAMRNAAFRQVANLPRVYPYYSHFEIGEDGRLWVRRAVQGAQDVWDLIEPTGRYLGEVILPRIAVGGAGPENVNTGRKAMRGDTLWTSVRTTDGVISVKRYRIAWQ